MLNPGPLGNISVLGRDTGYTVKYSPLSEGTPKGKGLYLSVYLEPSPNTDMISFLRIIMVNFCIVLQGSVILEEMVLGGHYITVHSLLATLHSILTRTNTGCFVYWEIHFSKREI